MLYHGVSCHSVSVNENHAEALVRDAANKGANLILLPAWLQDLSVPMQVSFLLTNTHTQMHTPTFSLANTYTLVFSRIICDLV